MLLIINRDNLILVIRIYIIIWIKTTDNKTIAIYIYDTTFNIVDKNYTKITIIVDNCKAWFWGK